MLQRVVPTAFIETFTETVVKAGFANTGIYLFDLKRILERAKLALPKKEVSQSSSSTMSQIKQVESLATVILGLDQPLKKTRQGRIPATNKLFTGEEI